MTNARFTSIDPIDDISTRNHYRVALEDGLSPEEAIKLVARYSRDNARVPFPWDDSENGGFSPAGVKTWLPVHPDYQTVNAAAEEKDPDSVLHFYKQMVALRKSEPTFVDGTFAPILRRYDKLIAYTRNGTSSGEKKFAVLCSFSDKPREVKLPFDVKEVRAASHNGAILVDRTLFLDAYQAVVLEIAEAE